MRRNVMQKKVAIVVGGALGIGQASALALARDGACVMIADLDLARAEDLAAKIREAGGNAGAVRCDAGNESEIIAMVDATVKIFGGLDILHNNAAFLGEAAIKGDGAVGEMDTALWDNVMAVNLRGPMLACKYALPHMLRRGGGSIINTSSGASLLGTLGRSAYSASKAGLNSLTRSVATQYGKQGIRCNAVAPGFIGDTETARQAPKKFQQAVLDNALTPYVGEARDVAEMVAFLASDRARFITGQIISIDGGSAAHQGSYADERRAAALPSQ
jgi:NAD(P)-dependent dehydrogenase (short-subunit alcohol dehydrogenase family)